MGQAIASPLRRSRAGGIGIVTEFAPLLSHVGRRQRSSFACQLLQDGPLLLNNDPPFTLGVSGATGIAAYAQVIGSWPALRRKLSPSS